MDSDNDDHEHSINDDYRMVVLRGDDESDLEADCEELFGGVDPIPIDVYDEDHDAGPGDNPNVVANAGVVVVDDGTVVTDAGGIKKRKATSEAWNDFEKIFETIDDKSIRTGAKCFHCGKYYLGLVLALAI
jgi:hypothetical protein